MKDESKRGHVGTVTWGHGAHIRGLEAQRLGCSERCTGSKGAAWGDRMIGFGYMTTGNIPVSGFPLYDLTLAVVRKGLTEGEGRVIGMI